MRLSRSAGAAGVLLVAMSLGGCAASGGDDPVARAEFAAMLRVEQVPGVLLAPYESYLQIDPNAPEDEIVETALAVRQILLELGNDDTRRHDVTIFAVYPGDWIINTEFTTRVIDDEQTFERNIRAWASLLDEGFGEVRYNVFTDGGDGVLNVNQRDPGEPAQPMSEVFDKMVAGLGGQSAQYKQLQTEAWIDGMLATNRSGTPELPAGWGALLDRVQQLDYVQSSNVSLEPGTSDLAMRGEGELTPERLAELNSLLIDSGVLLPNVTVSYRQVGSDAPSTLIYGVAK